MFFFVAVAGTIFNSSALGTTVDFRARFDAVRGVLVVVAAALVDRTLLGVVVRAAVDLRGERRLSGDSPFTPRSRRIWASAFPSAGTKILGVVSDVRENTERGLKRERTHHDRESAI